MAGRKPTAGPVVDVRVHLTGDAARAWLEYKAALTPPLPTDSAIGAFIMEQGLRAHTRPHARRKAG